VAVMNAGQIIALGRPEELGGRDLRPAEVRFTLPSEWSLGDLPDVPCETRNLEGDRVMVMTKEPVVAAQRITTWALEHEVDLGNFSVNQPTLEDIYLELTRSVEENDQIGEEAVR
jgi:ABC-2 type transport system ATP-binding protein